MGRGLKSALASASVDNAVPDPEQVGLPSAEVSVSAAPLIQKNLLNCEFWESFAKRDKIDLELDVWPRKRVLKQNYLLLQAQVFKCSLTLEYNTKACIFTTKASLQRLKMSQDID